MKKFLAILLAMMLVLVTAMTFALAEEGTPSGDNGNTEGEDGLRVPMGKDGDSVGG